MAAAMSSASAADVLDMSTARSFAESLMTSTCTIRSAGSVPVTAEDGEVTFPAGALVYSGPCRVRPASGPNGNSSDSDVGGVEVFSFDFLVSVPFSVSSVTERHRVAITASPDPALVGLDLEIRHVDRGEHITARRLACREVS